MIGILPCAGEAKRIHGLPKYLLPVGDSYLLKQHIDGMKAAGCTGIGIGTNEDNLPILRMMGFQPNAYIATHHETMTQTVFSTLTDTLNYGDPIPNALFGMPDTYFATSPYSYLLPAIVSSKWDVAVAVCKARPDQHGQGGMVGFDENFQVNEVVDKVDSTHLEYIWGAMAWKPTFWDCLSPDMPHVGYGLSAAIERGLKVRAVVIPGNFWDCGTPERYFEMIRATTCDPQLA